MSADLEALCALLEEYKSDLNAAEEENKRLKKALKDEQLSRRREQQEHINRTEELTESIHELEEALLVLDNEVLKLQQQDTAAATTATKRNFEDEIASLEEANVRLLQEKSVYETIISNYKSQLREAQQLLTLLQNNTPTTIDAACQTIPSSSNSSSTGTMSRSSSSSSVAPPITSLKLTPAIKQTNSRRNSHSSAESTPVSSAFRRLLSSRSASIHPVEDEKNEIPFSSIL